MVAPREHIAGDDEVMLGSPDEPLSGPGSDIILITKPAEVPMIVLGFRAAVTALVRGLEATKDPSDAEDAKKLRELPPAEQVKWVLARISSRSSFVLSAKSA
jgi:hypothetical protein